MVRRWIMHVDMDAFYASVEQRDNPELRGRPVIVGGTSDRGVVATASYEARAYGVHSALGTKKARRLCPDGIFLPPRIAYYRTISRQIRKIFEGYSPYIEPLSLDEAFLDISGLYGYYKDVLEVGRAVKRDIKEQTGLVASAGIGPNKFLAKLASDLDKPDGLVCIPYGKEEEMLAPLPIRKIWGVGKVTENRLLAAGYDTIGSIAAASPDKLRPLVGNQAERLYELAHGRDYRRVETAQQVKSIGNEQTYENDLVLQEDVDRQLRLLAEEVAHRLRKHGLMGRTITLKIRYNDFTTETRSESSESIGLYTEEQLYFSARKLYAKKIRKGSVRLLGITVSKLQTAIIQDSLFAEEPTTKKRLADEKVTTAIDKLQERFGKRAVMKGFLWEAESSVKEVKEKE